MIQYLILQQPNPSCTKYPKCVKSISIDLQLLSRIYTQSTVLRVWQITYVWAVRAAGHVGALYANIPHRRIKTTCEPQVTSLLRASILATSRPSPKILINNKHMLSNRMQCLASSKVSEIPPKMSQLNTDTMKFAAISSYVESSGLRTAGLNTLTSIKYQR